MNSTIAASSLIVSAAAGPTEFYTGTRQRVRNAAHPEPAHRNAVAGVPGTTAPAVNGDGTHLDRTAGSRLRTDTDQACCTAGRLRLAARTGLLSRRAAPPAIAGRASARAVNCQLNGLVGFSCVRSAASARASALLATAQCRFQQASDEQIALCMAAAEAMGDRAQSASSRLMRRRIVAASRTRSVPARAADRLRATSSRSCRCRRPCARASRSCAVRDRSAVPTDERHHGMHIVEGVVGRARRSAAHACGESLPARTRHPRRAATVATASRMHRSAPAESARAPHRCVRS